MGAFELAVIAIFSFLLLLRFVVVVGVAVVVIRQVRSCPACFLPTLPVRTRWRRVLPAAIEWRWCPDCGWQGPARK